MEIRKVSLNNYLKRLSPIKFLIIMTLINFLITFLLYNLVDLYSNFIAPITYAQSPIRNQSIFIQLLAGVLFAPLFETFIFQLLIIKVLSYFKFFQEKEYLIILISALIFSLSHNNSYDYMFKVFPCGLILAYTYCIYKNKVYINSTFSIKNSPFLMTTCVHSLSNLIIILLNRVS